MCLGLVPLRAIQLTTRRRLINVQGIRCIFTDTFTVLHTDCTLTEREFHMKHLRTQLTEIKTNFKETRQTNPNPQYI